MGRVRGAFKRDKNDGADRADGYVSVEELRALDNEKFTKFYRGKVVPDGEWEECLNAFRRGLPTCFRINTALPNASALRNFVERELRGSGFEPIAFIPKRMGYQAAVSRGEMKRDAEMKHAKQLLVALNAEGMVSRQEAVSMIPPLLLDVRAGHRVIDMCAAPGSKTTQILERLAAQGPGGIVVANDVNQGRLDVLTHQTARLPDAKSRLVITNHDATSFPLVMSADNKFDRVLCDVMCSGDGTLRKSVDLWARWNPLMGAHLHEQQARVLMRGMGLCKEGGIVVYSTCSMNPVEDEAVIARCLREAGGAFELIDPQEQLADLKMYHGMASWTLLTPNGEAEIHNTGAESKLTLDKQPCSGEAAPSQEGDQTSKPPRRGAKAKFTYTSSMFPPEATEAESLRLERCVRVAPHLQDTGGFFIAGLRCLRELPNTVSISHRAKYTCHFVPLSDDVLADVRKGVTLPDSFPFHRLFCNPETSRTPKIYYLAEDCAKSVSSINAKIVQVGVKVFESQVKHSWAHSRVAADGAATLAPLLGDLLLRTSAAHVLRAVGDIAAAPPKSFTVDGDHVRDFTEYCPPEIPTSGVVEVDCGESIGKIYLPFDTHRGFTVHLTPTQHTLLLVSAGKPLRPTDAAECDEPLPVQVDPPQPSAES